MRRLKKDIAGLKSKAEVEEVSKKSKGLEKISEKDIVWLKHTDHHVDALVNTWFGNIKVKMVNALVKLLSFNDAQATRRHVLPLALGERFESTGPCFVHTFNF